MASLSRRSLLRGLVAAPAVIAIDRLMPVKPIKNYWRISPGVYVREIDYVWRPAVQLVGEDNIALHSGDLVSIPSGPTAWIIEDGVRRAGHALVKRGNGDKEYYRRENGLWVRYT